MNLSGRTVLLTGATGGIGHAIARTLATRGAKLVLTGRRADVLEPLAAETGGSTLAVDLADRGEVDRLIAEAGAIDVLVANAALPASGPLDDFSVAEIDRALDVNLRAPIILAKALSAGMLDRGGDGHIVLISSLAGKAGTAGGSLYSATKFGLRGFGQALRGDLHGTRVGVSVIFPGFISDAGMFVESGAELPKGVGTRTPEDVAAAVIRGVEKNRGEIDVAPVSMRVSALFAQLAPSTAAAAARRMGGEELAVTMNAGQKDKR